MLMQATPSNVRKVRIRTKTLGRDVGPGDNPSILIELAHWAVEIVGKDVNFLVELQARDGIKSYVKTTDGKLFPGFFNPESVPDKLRLNFEGSTTLSDEQITVKKANEIIEKQLYYNAIGANCQSFATLLAKEISTHSTERLNNRVQRDGEEGLEPNPTVAKYIRFVPGPQQFLPPTVKLVVDHAAAVGVKVICNGCAKVERGFEDMLGIHF